MTFSINAIDEFALTCVVKALTVKVTKQTKVLVYYAAVSFMEEGILTVACYRVMICKTNDFCYNSVDVGCHSKLIIVDWLSALCRQTQQ